MQEHRQIEMRMDFTRIYLSYYPSMLRFSKVYVLSSEDAENIVQDVFVYLWEHNNLINSYTNISAFLFTMLRNKCIDFLRVSQNSPEKKQTLLEVSGKEMQFKLYSLQQLEESLLTVTDVEKLLDSAIKKLPKRCQEVFVLSRMEGLKNKEIADRLNVSVSTVENQITIAIRKLRIELKDYLPLFLFIV